MVILFIIFLFLYLLKHKHFIVKSEKYSLKNKVKLTRLVTINVAFFCYKNLECEIANNIKNNSITFNNLTMANTTIKTLKNAGFNLNLPIYKLEFYTKNKHNLFVNNNLKTAETFANNATKISRNKNIKVSKLTNNFKTVKQNKATNNNVGETLLTKNFNVLQNIYKNLQAIKNLQNKNINASFLIFLDEETLYKPVNKLINYFNVSIKIYIKNEVDYNLLGAINAVNINKINNLLNSKTEVNILLNNFKNSTLSLKEFKNNINSKTYENANYLNSNLQIVNKNNIQNFGLNNFFLQVKNDVFSFQNFNYNNYFLSSNLNTNLFLATLNCTLNFTEKVQIFKLKITNKTNSNLQINFMFLSSSSSKTSKNAVYFVDSSKYHIYLTNLINNNLHTFLVGKFSIMQVNNGVVFSQKKINILANQTAEFYFAYSSNFQNKLQVCNIINSNNLTQKTLKINALNLVNSLQNLYQNHNYNKLKNTKILTQNKTLNTLVNSYLPQKIIKNYIVNNFYNSFMPLQNIEAYNEDFNNLKNNVFNINLIDNFFNTINLNSIFLINKNLYKTYLNLIYFKLGFFASKKGLNINPNKSEVEPKGIVSLKQYENLVTVNVSKVNLCNEIKIDNIKYTNLNFLNITSKTKNLHLQF